MSATRARLGQPLRASRVLAATALLIQFRLVHSHVARGIDHGPRPESLEGRGHGHLIRDVQFGPRQQLIAKAA